MRIRRGFAQALIDQLIEIGGAAKHATAFDQEKLLIAQLQAVNKIMDQRAEFDSGDLQQLASGGVAGFGSGRHDGEHSGKHVVRSRNRAGLQFLPGGEAQFTENAIAERRVLLVFFEGTHSRHYRPTADVVGAAFIAKKRAVTADSHNLTVIVAADSSGTGSGKKHDDQTIASSLESKLQIGADANESTREFLGKQGLHSFGVFGLAGTGVASADGGQVVDGNAGALQGEARAIANGGHGAAKADAHGIGRAAAALREDAALDVDKDAVSLGAATVETESQFHETGIRERRNFRSGGVAELPKM